MQTKEENKDSISLNKYISERGYCSRREADQLIEQGRVFINKKKARKGNRVFANDVVSIDGKKIRSKNERVYLLFNKPRGIICTTDPKVKDNIINFINYPKRIFPVGRLDVASEGLILLTDDGNIVNRILRSQYETEKEYWVKVNKPVTETFLKHMRNGVPILDTITKKCKVEKAGIATFKIILTQGLNRQIRRMCDHFGYEVIKLRRIRIMHFTLEGLDTGKWRKLSSREIHFLKRNLGVPKSK